MANRLLLGNAGSGYEFKISRPGFNVLTATADQLLFDADKPLMQIVAQGVAMVPPGGESEWRYVNVTIPSQGYLPLIGLQGGTGISFRYLSLTSIRIGAYYFIGGQIDPTPVPYVVFDTRFS